jgi:hypothetical protein
MAVTTRIRKAPVVASPAAGTARMIASSVTALRVDHWFEQIVSHDAPLTPHRRRPKSSAHAMKKMRHRLIPACGVGLTVDIGEDALHLVPVGIELAQPGFGRLLVVRSRPTSSPEPRCSSSSYSVQQIETGHDPAREEMLVTSSRRTFRPSNAYGICPVAEDVNEEPALRARASSADAAEQFAVVTHVLEHLDRDHAIEAPRSMANSFISAVITWMLYNPRSSARCMMDSSLRCGVRHGGDGGVGIVRRHPQCQ